MRAWCPFGVQIVYYDGQFDDARLNVTLAVSAALAGAATVNYAEVTRLLKVRQNVPAGLYRALEGHSPAQQLLAMHELHITLQDERGLVIGAAVHDNLGRKSYDVYAKQVGQGHTVQTIGILLL